MFLKKSWGLRSGNSKKTNKLSVVRCDITKMEVDAIVSSANRSLFGGGGVDGAIHRAAGPGLLEECKKLNGCETGQAKITAGYNLKAKYVIHTVGPIWKGGIADEPGLLASCYQQSLALAKKYNIKTIAFPGISTGTYGFPKDLAALIAVTETKRFILTNKIPEKIIFVVFDEDNFKIYKNLLEEE